jgi:penicillin-binding protein A
VRPAVRPVAVTLLSLMAAMAVWLTYASAHAGSRYRDDARNLRAIAAVDGARGRVLTADGVVVAEDSATGARSYPRGADYAHLVGYDAEAGRRGLESTRLRDLLGRDDGSLTAWLIRLTGCDLGAPDIRLTIVDAVQRSAVSALEGRTGAVVAIDPRTGAVLAYASSPSFDPNAVVDGSLDLLGDEVSESLLDRAAGRLLPPGSTFKVIVTAAALADGADADTAYPDSASYTPPGGMPIRNAVAGPCGRGSTITLIDSLVVSCNTVFAALAVDLGAERIVGMAERLGFNTHIPWEIGAAGSVIPPAPGLDADPPALAQSGIGERDVRATPLLMAMIAAAIANEGVMMSPHVVAEVIAPDGTVLQRTPTEALDTVVPAAIASMMLDMMEQVVLRGTGTAAAVPGTRVAGKTGTAEGGGGPHAWFIGVAPVEAPTIAVAVVVESGGPGTTGGRTAAPIAARVITAWTNLAHG